jgi:serine/threonine-protein kinase
MHIEQLGPYRIGKKLGRGGMGSVYEAWDNTSGIRVAVKTLSPHLAMAEGFRDRFEAEIDSLKKLQHAGIVRLYGYGEQEGILFYSMEVVDGTSLEEEIAAGRRFDWHETLDMGIQVCRALKHAHDHGVVHRDIKPANLLLTAGGQVKIADFGIARLFGGNQLTTAGGVLGTADYMSPEQADGRPITEKCDQYSLGGVLYALLTGQPPFRASSMPEMLQLQRFAEPVPVRRIAPDTPEQLERLILQLLAKEPEDRFPNVMVLGRHMEAMAKALSRPESLNTNAGKTESSDNSRVDRSQGDRSTTDKLHAPALALQGDALLPAGMENVSSHLFNAPTMADPLADAREGAEANATSSTEDSSRFTTVDQEEADRQTEPHTNLLQLTVQLLAILATLGLLVWSGWWLMRPATADDLYAQIMGTVKENGTDYLRLIEKPLREFYQRFEHDPRTVKLDYYREELELLQMERKLRRKVKFGGASQVSPIGQLYGMAISAASTDPQRGVDMLTSLLVLYDPQSLSNPASALSKEASASLSEEDGRWLVLAKRQIDSLLDQSQKQRASLMRSLNERLQAAIDLQQTHPKMAARMFQAIVNLNSGQAWASEIVAQARLNLKLASNAKGLP